MTNKLMALLALGMLLFTQTVHAEEGFVPLFNGRDLGGWINVNCAEDTWQTSGGVIYCTGQPTGELRTERMYQNFILDVEWRHLKPKGNAGVFVWADPLTARGQPFVRGVEVQVLDGQEAAWFTSDGDIFPIHGAHMVPENGRGGDRAFPTEKRAKPAPEWNHYRIECVDGRIALAVNGKVVTQGHSISPRKGYICLESEGSPAEFRNIQLKELPATQAVSPEQIANPDEGFKSLYNGQSLAGWVAADYAKSHWKSNDWILEHDGKQGAGDSHLWTENEYGDFILMVDWCWAEKKADSEWDSGIFLRGSEKCEVDIGSSPAGSGAVSSSGAAKNAVKDDRNTTMPNIKADEPVGAWNRYMITLRGNEISVILNGKTIVKNARLSGIGPKGRIGLQHGNGAIKFANLFIKRLD